MSSYYNEIDAKCCNVLRRQIASGLLPDGLIDSRSIEEVQPDDVKGYDECHFFAGIGGFPAGFARAGVTGVNVWTGGFPCQNLSVAGKREGLVGKRSGLWFEFHRLITAVYPEWVVIENVPGLFSSRQGRDFAILLGGLTGIIPQVPADGWGNAGAARGPIYSVAWRILDAQYAGVAQRRRRVFIVGHLGDGRAAEVLFERTSSAWDTPPSRETGQRVADPITASPYGDNEAQHRKLIVFDWQVGGTQRTRIVRSGEYAQITANHVDAVAFQPRFARNGRGAPDTIVPPLTAEAGRTGKGDSATCVAFGVSENQRAEVRLTEYSRQLTSGGGKPGQGYTAALTQYGVRRLTPTEACRLQGFSDNWNAQGIDEQGAPVAMSDSARYGQLGNAVAVPCAQWLGHRILEAL